MKIRVGVALATTLAGTTLAHAQPTSLTLNHTGYLVDSGDQPVNQDVQATFRIVDKQGSGESESWKASCTVKVSKGYFNVALGSDCGTALTADAFPPGAERFLEMAIGTATLSPRLRLGVVPTAAQALNAQNLGGKAPTAYWQKSDQVDAATLGGKALTDLDARWITAQTGQVAPQAGSVSVQGEVGASALRAAGEITAGGSVTAQAFAGDGSKVTAVDAAKLGGAAPDQYWKKGDSVAAASVGGKTLAELDQRYPVLGGSGQGALNLAGNVTAGAFIGDGAQLTGVAKLATDNVFTGKIGIGNAAGTNARFQVGNTNVAELARGKTVVASSGCAPSFGAPALLTNGAFAPNGAGWNDANYAVRLNTVGVGCALTVDLGQVQDRINRVVLQADMNDNYTVEISDDLLNWSPLYVTAWTNVQGNGGLVQRDSGPIAPSKGRYVRVYASGGDGSFSVSELQLFQEANAVTIGTNGYLGVGTQTPAATLDVNGTMIRAINRWQSIGNSDGTDVGTLSGRTVFVRKALPETGLRVTWSDNFRVNTYNSACRWEVMFNGQSCTSPGGLVLDKYEGNTGSNRHDPSSFVGTCFGLGAGPVTVNTRVYPVPGYTTADCVTGWNGQFVSLEVEEVR